MSAFTESKPSVGVDTAAATAQPATYPNTKLVVRTKEGGIRAYFGPPTEPSREQNVLDGIQLEVDSEYVSTYAPAGVGAPVVPTVAPVFSSNGALGAVLLPSGQAVITAAHTGVCVTELPCDPTTMHVEFSPLGNFLVAWSRPVAGNSNNLKIWNVSSGECVCSYAQRNYKKELMQWTNDESVCCRLVTNEVHILDGRHPEQGIIGKVYHKGVNAFKICPVSGKPYICVFSPSTRGTNGQVSLYRYTKADIAKAGSEDTAPSAHSVCSRAVMSATEANILWSPTGMAALIHTQSEVDSSNSSYYGASGLIIMACNGCVDGNADRDDIDPLSAAVAQGKDGHIHDVQWSPVGNQFAISAGSMPCVCTLHNQKGEKIFDFGAAHRNTISWSPHGRFLALAGFGNLVGDIDFYDTQAKKIKKMSTNNSHCAVTHAWSPDSRYFMTATLAPRMNVDNGFKIFRYDGKGPIFTENLNHAYDAQWIPANADVYPNRARSPSRNAPDGSDTPATSSSTAAAKPAAAPVAAYRPPGSSGALAEAMRRPAAQAGKVVASKPAAAAPAPGKYVAPQRKIPGMAAPAANSAGGKKKVVPPPASRL